jgi:hypothetical protein
LVRKRLPEFIKDKRKEIIHNRQHHS